jgi:hypothetical protein
VTVLSVPWLSPLLLIAGFGLIFYAGYSSSRTKARKKHQKKSPLIVFAASYYITTQEPLDLFRLGQTERKTYWVYISNPSIEDTIHNVSVAITKLEPIDRTGKRNPFNLPPATRIPPYGLWFWEKDSSSVDLAPLQQERIKVISATKHTNTSPFSRDIRIEVNNEEIVLRAGPNDTYKIVLTVTALDRLPQTRTFSVYLVDKGQGAYDLNMEPEQWMENYEAMSS